MSISTAQTYDSGFSRKFGTTAHYWSLHSDGQTNLIDVVTRDLAPWASDRLNTEAGCTDSQILSFCPLFPTQARQQLIWIEIYRDIVDWAKAERWAQRSPIWWGRLRGLFERPGVGSGQSQVMVDDTSAVVERGPLVRPFEVLHWVTTKGAVMNNQAVLPAMAAQLSEILRKREVDAVVRFFGTTTSAGPERNLGHLWVELGTADDLARYSRCAESEDYAAWKRAYFSAVEGVEKDQLLRRLG